MHALKKLNEVVLGVALRKPYVASDTGGNDECFYCQNTKGEEHKDSCTYRHAIDLFEADVVT